MKWLLPRLPRLSLQHPKRLVMLDTTDKAIHFSTGEADVAIRLGNGRYTALYSAFLFREHIFPVASPHLLSCIEMPRTPVELLRYSLLTRDGCAISPSLPQDSRWYWGFRSLAFFSGC